MSRVSKITTTDVLAFAAAVSPEAIHASQNYTINDFRLDGVYRLVYADGQKVSETKLSETEIAQLTQG